MVLLGVEHFEQRRTRIAAEVVAELVDLVEQHHRVVRTGGFEALQDAAGQRPDVGAAVALDLGLVAHAAEREAIEPAPHRARDAAAEARLADTGRTGEAEDRTGVAGLELAHGEELEDAVLDLVEPVVVVGEHARGAREVGVVGRGDAPRQRYEPVEVVADHAVLAGLDRRGLQARQLLARALLRGVGHLRLADRVFEPLELERARILLFAEFTADDLELLAQEVVLLRLLGLVADLAEDLLVERDQFALGHCELQRELEPLLDVDLFEQALAIGDLPHHAGGEVGELARHVDVEQRGGEAGVELLLQFGELPQLLLQQAEQRRRALALRRDLDQLLHAHDEVRLVAHHLDQARAPHALGHRRHAAVGQLEGLVDARDHPDLEDVGGADVLLLGVLLQHQEQVSVVRLGLGAEPAANHAERADVAVMIVHQRRHDEVRQADLGRRRRPVEMVVLDLGLERAIGIVTPVGDQLVETGRIDHRARQNMRADFGAFLDQHHGEVGIDLLEPDRRAQARRTAADDDDVIFHSLAGRQRFGGHGGPRTFLKSV